ncbi:MAG: helix-turn-helix transcriptional regulator [Pseudomonadota bacterium]
MNRDSTPMVAFDEFIGAALKSGKGEYPKLTRIEFKILEILINNGPSYGLDIVKKSGGVIKRGTVYVMLERMEQNRALVASEDGEKGKVTIRRKFRPTGKGERAYRAACIASYTYEALGAMAWA